MGECAEPRSKASSLLTFMKRPLVIIVVAGLLIRVVLIPLFTYNYDISFWATTIQHAQSGNGLYGLSGYFYTPVWGYILGFLGLVANFIFGISSYGTIGDQLFPSAGADWDYYGTMVVSPEFSLLVKSFLVMFDLICAYLVYVIVKRFGHDESKAVIAFALWFLCPIVIYASSVQATFDNISITFMLLAFVMMIDRKYMPAGALLAIAALTKFFPAYLGFMFLIYALKKNEGKDAKIGAVVQAVIGIAVAAFVVLLPQVINGTLPEAFGFITNRVSSIVDASSSAWDLIATGGMNAVVLLQLVIFALLIFIAYRTYKTEDSKFDRTFMMMMMLSSAIVFLWTPAPPYLLLMMPFLIYVVSTAKSENQKRYIIPFTLISVTATLYSISMHSYSVLFQISVYYDLVSPETILNGFKWLGQMVIPGVTRQTLLNLIMGAAETIAIYSIFLVYAYNHRKSKTYDGGAA